jgi:type II secretory pathway pseudopilin PulG
LEKNAVRRFLLVLGALAIVVAGFLATLLLLNYREGQRAPAETRNATRAGHARQLKAALENYRTAHKTYPMSADFIEVGNLQRDLVGGGYLTEIPSDPQDANGKKYRYASNGSVYGLLLELEAGPTGTPAASTCITRAKTDTSSFKGFAPDCPF